MMQKLFSIIMAILFIVVSANNVLADSDKILHLKKTTSFISIDGIVDLAWNKADSISDFIQFRPYYFNNNESNI